VKNASRNEKYRKRRADGLLRHQLVLANKQAEIDHLKGSLTGVLGQMANFEGVAEIIRDYQKSVQPWDDDEPVDLMYCRGCGGRGIRAEYELSIPVCWRPGSRASGWRMGEWSSAVRRGVTAAEGAGRRAGWGGCERAGELD
jgi:hypothetical protein